jgi:hypothetical protein
LLLAGGASAQSVTQGTVEWYPAGQGKPQPLPAAVQKAQNVEPAQFKAPPPTPLPDRILRVGAQAGKIKSAEQDYEFSIQIELPGLDRLTQRRSEAEFFQALRDEARFKPGVGRIYFPEQERVSDQVYTGRQFPYMVRFVEPQYVCHMPLLFEQKNFERYGWDLGPISPGIEAGMFFYDLVMLPYHVGSQACRCFDCSAGKCLPGDPTPLLLYREQFSVTGLVFEFGTIFGGAFAIP